MEKIENNECFNINEVVIKIEKYNQKINEKIYNFVMKAKELEKVSDYNYEIQKSLEINKIFFRGYILESNILMMLKEINKTNYSMDELKQIMKNYELQNPNEYFYPYYLSFDLYDMVDEIEEIIDNKIDFEMNLFNNMNIDIKKIFNMTKNEYEKFYIEIKNKLYLNYLNEKLIDEKVYNLYIQILNDIFIYYINGYLNIPDAFLDNEKNNLN